MEVKIGVTDSPRELVLQSAQTPSDVEELVVAALGKDSGVLARSPLYPQWRQAVEKAFAQIDEGAGPGTALPPIR